MLKRVALLLVWSLAAAGLGSGPSRAAETAYVEGKLDNGVRYRIQRQPFPAGSVSLRLGVDIGSYDEADDELGFAHFLEHMAFNGTRTIEEDRIEETFAARGVAFGRDLNAATSAFQTTYKLDLPQADRRTLDLAFAWLSDVAYGLRLEPAAVERERGVVLAELEADYGPERRVSERLAEFYGAERRLVQRRPIGTRASLAGATAERLRAFHERWYRPENAVVVVVGDLDPKTAEKRVRAAFGRWKVAGAAGTRADTDRPSGGRGLDALVLTERGTAAALSACRFQPGDESTDAAAVQRAGVLDGLWTEILNRRFDLVEEDGSTGVVSAGASTDGNARGGRATCLGAAPSGGRWAAALAALQREAVRFGRDGPTELELEAAVEEARSGLRGALTGEPTAPAAVLADALAATALDGLPFPNARERMRTFNATVAGLSPDALRRAFLQRWSTGDGPLLVLNAAEPPARQALLDAWRAGETASPPAFTPPPPPRWAYREFGPDALPIKRERVDKGDFVRFRYANGLVVNYKRTTAARQVVNLGVIFGRGRGDLARGDLFTAEFGAGSFDEGGLGKHGAAELQRLFASYGTDVELNVRPWYFSLHGEISASSLNEQLALWAAYLTDPGFRPTIDNAAPTYMDAWRQYTRADPTAAASAALIRTMAPDDPRLPADDGGYVAAADIRRVLEPVVKRGPLELTVVGDVPEETVLDAVKWTLGALPARPPVPPAPSDVWYLRVDPAAPRPATETVHEGAPDQAATVFAWPLYVADESRRREEYAILLLGMILELELRREVRERLGASYSPSVWMESPDDTDQGVLYAAVATRPSDVDAVTAAVRAIAAKLVAGEVTQAQLDAVRKPLLAGRDADETTNLFWLGALTATSRFDDGLNESMQYRRMISDLTPSDLQAAGRKWLAQTPFVAVARPSPEVLAAARETSK